MPKPKPLIPNNNCEQLPCHVYNAGGSDLGACKHISFPREVKTSIVATQLSTTANRQKAAPTWDLRPIYWHFGNWYVQLLGQKN